MFVLSHIKDNSQLKTGKILEMKRRWYKDIETLEILWLSRDQVTFHMKKARDIYKKIKDDNSIREIEERL